jgi:hypothetical protein
MRVVKYHLRDRDPARQGNAGMNKGMSLNPAATNIDVFVPIAFGIPVRQKGRNYHP